MSHSRPFFETPPLRLIRARAPHVAMLPPPHGGRLVDRLIAPTAGERRREDAIELPRLAPFVDEIYDAEKIGIGAYSPLEGFQGSEAVGSVLEAGRLPGGAPWPIPIVLAPRGRQNEAVVARLRPGDEVGLVDGSNRVFAILHLEEKFAFDRARYCQKVYGTVDPAHPNVADAMGAGATGLAGRIDLLRRLEVPSGRFELTPAETRAEFLRRGWSKVAGYQTRNVPHAAHEYLQRCTLEREEIDGLLIHPVLGRLKRGDYRPEIILEAYRTLVRRYYPPDRVVLAALSITMRYAGPKAALFLAIVRKNFGCSHYIVGRDQAGVGGYYAPKACQEIFERFDVGIVPIRYAETFYCRECRGMASDRTCSHPVERRIATSQTKIRTALERGEPVPRELVRPEIAALLTGQDVLLRA
jgi:sulfate adenylyltransferase